MMESKIVDVTWKKILRGSGVTTLVRLARNGVQSGLKKAELLRELGF